MGGLPDIIFVIDTNKEAIAVQEANKLGLPVVAVCDSNSNPQGIRYPFPGNDDASRAINLYCDLVVGAVLDGIQAEMTASGIDVGAHETPIEELPDEGELGAGDLGAIEPLTAGEPAPLEPEAAAADEEARPPASA
jgi:small subunit ribosomal protein S2